MVYITRTLLYSYFMDSHFSQGHLCVRHFGAYILSQSIFVCFGKETKIPVVEYFS